MQQPKAYASGHQDGPKAATHPEDSSIPSYIYSLYVNPAAAPFADASIWHVDRVMEHYKPRLCNSSHALRLLQVSYPKQKK